MVTRLFTLVVLLLSIQLLDAQIKFDKVEVRLVKNNYLLFNVESNKKIAKLCSVKNSILEDGTIVISEINSYIVSTVEFKKDQEIHTVFNSEGNLNQKFKFIIPVQTSAGFTSAKSSGNLIIKELPGFGAIPTGDDTYYGIFRLDGSEFIPPNFYYIEIHHQANESIYFKVKDANNKFGIYLEDKELIPTQFNDIGPVELNTFVPVSKYNTNGVYNLDGDIIVSLDKHDVTINKDSTFTIDNDSKQALIDKNGKLIIPLEFDYIEKINSKRYYVDLDDNRGIFDIDSQKIVEYINVADEDENESGTDEVFTIVDQMPVFPGGKGDAGISLFIAQNTKYPPMALDNDIEGKVYVKFVVDKRGKVRDVEIAKGADPILNNEALRVIKSLPDFKPGMQDGKKVKVQYVVPINFRLS